MPAPRKAKAAAAVADETPAAEPEPTAGSAKKATKAPAKKTAKAPAKNAPAATAPTPAEKTATTPAKTPPAKTPPARTVAGKNGTATKAAPVEDTALPADLAESSEEPVLMNRAMRRAKGKGGRPSQAYGPARVPGSKGSAHTHRMWANRRSGG